MNRKLQQTALIAITLLSAVAAQAAPAQVVHKLPRVVITGKAAQAETTQVAAVQQLPRVVISGLSIAGQQRQQQVLLAQASAAKPAGRI